MSKHTIRATLTSLGFVLATTGITACASGFQLGGSGSSSFIPGSRTTPAPAPATAPASTADAPDAPTPSAEPQHEDQLRRVTEALAKTLRELDVAKIHEERLERASPEHAPGFAAVGEACAAAVELAISQGVPRPITLTVGGLTTEVTTTLGEARSTVCDVLIAKAKTWEARVAGAQQSTHTRVAAPYKALGITGDKLALLVEHIDVAMFGIGGRELTTPMQAKRASVIFELLERDREWTLRRFQFAGNKLVGTTHEGFATKPGSSKYR